MFSRQYQQVGLEISWGNTGRVVESILTTEHSSLLSGDVDAAHIVRRHFMSCLGSNSTSSKIILEDDKLAEMDQISGSTCRYSR